MKIFLKSLAISVVLMYSAAFPAFATDIISNFSDMENKLYTHFENRDTNFSFIYTGKKDEFKDNINKVIRKAYSRNDYLERSWLEVKPLAKVTSKGIDTTIDVTYLSTKAEEEYVDKELKSICETLIKTNMTDFEKVRAINDYIVDRYEYDYSLKSASPYLALKTSKTVCQGYAMTAYKMFNNAGLENRIVVGTARGISHAWNVVKINGKWYQIDITNNDSVKADKYFLVSDKFLEDNNYVWDKEKYPKALEGYYK